MPSFLHRTKGVLRSLLYRRVDRVVAVTRGVAQDIQRNYGVSPSRIRVIGNGVDTAKFKPMHKSEACLTMHLNKDTPRAIFVGNLVPWRDFDTLLAASGIVRESYPDAELLIVGGGPLRKNLERTVREGAIRDNVLFLGSVSHSRVPTYIACSDVCLLPARPWTAELSPIKLFEYLACGRPVIATRMPGLDFLDSIGAGLVVPALNPTAFAQAIVRLFASPGLREEMGRKGRSFIERGRSWDEVASRVITVIEETRHPA